MNPVEIYFHDLAQIHSTGAGVPETSNYGALERLLNEIGKTLKPKIRCILTLANRGAGNPDGGLFTSNQFQKDNPLPGQPPERGVIEVKPLSDDAWVTARGSQVSRYWGKYGLILVTNYRDFVLLGKDPNGQPVKLETFRLAGSESDFWGLAQHPQKAAILHGQRLIEYLKRAMLQAAPLSTPEDVAWFLASYARDAKSRIEDVDLPALSVVREALEEALGLKFEGIKGEHFFRSTLIQTLFYGIFSAWVLWSKQKNRTGNGSVRFDWRQAAWSLHVPMIRALFEQVAAPTKLLPLKLVEPLEWASLVLNRVDRTAFFATFDQGYAVQYFYEPFLQQFDPELRKELGVWYTPPEIVKYMVARVDAVLKEESEIEDGLADPRVYVLDPCCGTGAYLVEVLHKVYDTMKSKGIDALAAQDLKKAAMGRIFGFEILPAPFVVSHLQLGLLLQQFGAPLSHSESERVAVYLTNSLTGWEPPKEPKQRLLFPEMEEERDAAEGIKREKPILVILGNPPYNAFAGVSPAEEEGLVEPYKENLNKPIAAGGWGIKKFNLDDLYIRFFRLAERRIVEREPGKGIVSFISNFSYLSDPSFVVMRQRFLREFDALWLDCMNGDSRETGKLTPDGKPDPSVFSTEYHQVGIRVGTAIAVLVRKDDRVRTPPVRYREFWGVTKRADLLDSLNVKKFNSRYGLANPSRGNRYSFRPDKISAEYLSWPKVVELCGIEPISGLQEMRKGALMDICRDVLEKRIQAYYDPKVDWATFKSLRMGLAEDGGRFDAKACRMKVQKANIFDPQRVLRYALHPFDVRWCYYTDVRPLWNEPRPALVAQNWKGNSFFITRMMAERPHEQIAMIATPCLPDYHLLRPNTVAIPIRIRGATETKAGETGQLFSNSPGNLIANLSPKARGYLQKLKICGADVDAETAELIWMHGLAIGYSPVYLTENFDGIRNNWPRIPLPDSRDALQASAELGRQVAGLLDTDSNVKGVTSGYIRPELKLLGVVSTSGEKALNPGAGDLDLTAGWGHSGKAGVTMPGQGRTIDRPYTSEELSTFEAGAVALEQTLDMILKQLGKVTLDVYLNTSAFWRNVPSNVWEYNIGGYQVIKKWLSYRERGILGRALVMEEAREVTNIVRRIAAILMLGPKLDKNYQQIKRSCNSWPGK